MLTVHTKGELFWVLLGRIGACSLDFEGSSNTTDWDEPRRLVCALPVLIFQNTGERHCISAVAFVVAGGGFEPPTFGLCDLTHLSVRVGLYLHPRGVLAIQSLRLPRSIGAWFGIAISLARRRFHRL